MLKDAPHAEVAPEVARQPAMGMPCVDALAGRAHVHSSSELHFHRLRYFIDLLIAGYRQAQRPDPMPRSLRGERIALGIDLPELDTVPLWTVRRDDGMVAIPCVVYILDQARGSLDLFCREEDHDLSGEGHVGACRAALDKALVEARGGSKTDPAGPRLHDVFLPGDLLDKLCASGGLLERAVRDCEAILAREAAGVRH